MFRLLRRLYHKVKCQAQLCVVTDFYLTAKPLCDLSNGIDFGDSGFLFLFEGLAKYSLPKWREAGAKSYYISSDSLPIQANFIFACTRFLKRCTSLMPSCYFCAKFCTLHRFGDEITMMSHWFEA